MREDLRDAREREAAVSEVLAEIGHAGFDPQAVFDLALSHAGRLSDAGGGILWLREGDLFRHVAGWSDDGSNLEAAIDYYRQRQWPVTGTGVTGRVYRVAAVVQIPDVTLDPEYPKEQLQHLSDYRTVLGVPLLKDGTVIGVLSLGRRAVKPFSDHDITLVRTFADQAVLALENARLLKETNEALEQQTATAEILRAISGSPTDVQPVLDAIAANALRFCGAEDAVVNILELGALKAKAHAGPVPATGSQFQLMPVDRNNVSGHSFLDRQTVHVADLQNDADHPLGREVAKFRGFRTTLATPLLRRGEPIGVILLRRRVVQPFTPQQIALVEAFAAQAVIAIENVRLFNETKEALERQTATSEVLKVISNSAFELQPVFQTLIEKAVRLGGADNGSIARREGEELVYTAHAGRWTHFGDDDPMSGRTRQPIKAGRDQISGRVLLEGRSVQIPDIRADPEYDADATTQFRAGLGVPILRAGELVGIIILRRYEPGPFSDERIELLESFADQGAIAIENVRLFNETKEALERQTATAEILRAISRSPTDVQPVLDAIATNAVRYCGGETAWLHLFDEGRHVGWAHSGPFSEAEREALRIERPPAEPGMLVRRDRIQGRAILDRVTIHVPDVRDPATIADFPDGLGHGRAAELAHRAALVAPLLRQADAIGTIELTRTAPGPFTAEQIALVETFAAQAVIAIENVRLFNETKEALERQTAIGEVLDAINGSAFDLAPVLDSVIKNAMRLCAADNGSILRLDNGVALGLANAGPNLLRDAPQTKVRTEYRLDRSTITGRVALESRTVQIVDVLADADYGEEYKAPLRAAARNGALTILGVPLIRGGETVGVIVLRRARVAAFSAAEVSLVEAFAGQAVIAIENARLFNETSEALEQQTATAEVLKVISRAPFEIDRVLDIVVNSAATLCAADRGSLWRLGADGAFRLTAYMGGDPAFRAAQQATTLVMDRSTISGRVALERRTIHIADYAADPDYQPGVQAAASAPRASLGVPLLREDQLFGVFVLTRTEPRPFSDREIALVNAFADQAVIAIENVRLVSEIQDKSLQLELASRHKTEFMANMSHELRTPLNAIIGFSDVLEQRMFGALNDRQSEYVRDIAGSGRHLLDLVNEILDLAKVEAGRMELETSEFALAETISGALAFVRERAAANHIELKAQLPENLGSLTADERKLRQVLLNLLSNAVKFTPDGGRVTLRAQRTASEIQVSVQDTGIGIASEDQPRVFEEFRQVGKTSDRSREGTGLGLTLAKRFIELHGGRIWVESEVGQGTTFTFAIPVAPAVTAPV